MQSLAGLCPAPEHRRGHGALYDALSCRMVDAERLRAELTDSPLPRMFGGRIALPSMAPAGCARRTREPPEHAAEFVGVGDDHG